MRKRRLKVVEVKWQDAESSSGWFRFDQKEECVLVSTVGLYVGKTPDSVVLASSLDPETGKFCDKHKIPKGMVKEQRTIEIITI